MIKNKIPKLALLAAGLAVSVITSQAALSLSFSNQGLNTGIQFNGAASSFQLNPAPGSLAAPQFKITSEVGGTAAVGLLGWINGSPWTIGAITTVGTLQSAPVTGAATLFLNDGLGAAPANNLTGNLSWLSIVTLESLGGINAALNLNVSGLSYTGLNPDLLALAAGGNGSLNLTFQFNPGQSLTQLTTGTSQVGSYSGSLNGVTPVPEPGTMIAGALLLLPFGATVLRIVRKRQGLDLPDTY
jgi:hypothetical protein